MGSLFKIDKRTILFVVMGIAIVGLALFFIFSKSAERKAPGITQESGETQLPSPSPGSVEIMEISGWVSDVNVSKNSFVITSRKDEIYEVLLGKNTQLKEYIVPTFFPHDLPNTPSEQVVSVKLAEIKKGDQVSITASAPIYSGKPIKDPIEVQVFH